MKEIPWLNKDDDDDDDDDNDDPVAVCRRCPILHLVEERQSGVKFLV